MEIKSNHVKFMSLAIAAIVMAAVVAFGGIIHAEAAAGEMKPESVDPGANWYVSDPLIEVAPGQYKPGELGLVLKKGKIGFINSNGTEVIPCQYDNDILSKFNSRGYAVVSKDGKQGIINTSGETVVPFVYDSIDCEMGNSDYISASKDGKSGYICLTGEDGLPFCFDETWSFNSEAEKYGAVSVNGKWGLISPERKIVLPVQYDAIDYDHGGYFTVEFNGKEGLIGPDLKQVMPIEFTSVEVVPMGETYTICAVKDGKSYIYSIDGKQVADCGECELDHDFDGNNIGIVAAMFVSGDDSDDDASFSESYILYNISGKKISDKSFTWYQIAGNAIAAETGSACGMIDAAGKELVPFKYDKMQVIENSKEPAWVAFYKKGEGWTVFDDEGKAVKELAWMKLTVPEESEISLIGNDRIYVSDEEANYGPSVGNLYDLAGKKINQGKIEIISWQKIGRTAAAIDGETGKYGIMSFDGNMLLPCEYAAIEASDSKIGNFYFAYDEDPAEDDDSDESEKVYYINAGGKKVSEKIYDDPWDSFLDRFTD